MDNTKSNQNEPPTIKKKWQKHSENTKRKIVLSINKLWAEGGEMQSACEAYGISHNTYWTWRRADPELLEDFERCNDERHAVKGEVLREAAFMAAAHLIKPEKRTRVVKEGKTDRNGKFVVSKITTFEEYREPHWPAVREILVAYAPETFKNAGDNTLRVIFADDAEPISHENKSSLNHPEE